MTRIRNPHPDPFTDRLYSGLGISWTDSQRLKDWILERLDPRAADEVIGQALEVAPMLDQDTTPEAWVRKRVAGMVRPAETTPRASRPVIESPPTYLHHVDAEEHARIGSLITDMRQTIRNAGGAGTGEGRAASRSKIKGGS